MARMLARVRDKQSKVVNDKDESKQAVKSAWRTFIRSLILVLFGVLFMIILGIGVFSILSALALSRGPM
jgi:uncharacterized membrane protein